MGVIARALPFHSTRPTGLLLYPASPFRVRLGHILKPMDKLSATTFWFEVGRVILYGVIFSFVIMVAEGGKRPVYDLTWLYRLVWAIVVPVILGMFWDRFSWTRVSGAI